MAHRTNIPTKWTLAEPPGTGLKAPMASGKGRDSEEEREVYKKAEERHWMIYGNPKKAQFAMDGQVHKYRHLPTPPRWGKG
jgi:hypothetical protein